MEHTLVSTLIIYMVFALGLCSPRLLTSGPSLKPGGCGCGPLGISPRPPTRSRSYMAGLGMDVYSGHNLCIYILCICFVGVYIPRGPSGRPTIFVTLSSPYHFESTSSPYHFERSSSPYDLETSSSPYDFLGGPRGFPFHCSIVRWFPVSGIKKKREEKAVRVAHTRLGRLSGRPTGEAHGTGLIPRICCELRY